MPKKIRVYELARELGISNQSTLDLCVSLGMGVKSHSSSIEEAQADRARRKARREGLGSTPDQQSRGDGSRTRRSSGLRSRGSSNRRRPAARIRSRSSVRSQAANRQARTGVVSASQRSDRHSFGQNSPNIESATAVRSGSTDGRKLGQVLKAAASQNDLRYKATDSQETSESAQQPFQPKPVSTKSSDSSTLKSSPLKADRPSTAVIELGSIVAEPDMAAEPDVVIESAASDVSAVDGAQEGPLQSPTQEDEQRSTAASKQLTDLLSASVRSLETPLSDSADPSDSDSAPNVDVLPTDAAKRTTKEETSIRQPDKGPTETQRTVTHTQHSDTRQSDAGPAEDRRKVKSVGESTQPRSAVKTKPKKRMPQRPKPPLSRSGKPIPPPPPPRGPNTGFDRSSRGRRAPGERSSRGRGGPGRRPRPAGGGRPSRGAGRPATSVSRPGAPARSTPSSAPRSRDITKSRSSQAPSGGARRPGGAQRRTSPGPGRGQRVGPYRPTQKRRKRRTRKREALKPMDVPTYTPTDAPVPAGVVVVERTSTAQHLGPKLNRTAADVVRFLMEHGEMVTATQSLSDEMIELFALDIGANIRLVDLGEEQEAELQELLDIDSALEDGDDDDRAEPRPPVVTVMGHVDHGKTLLLDRIRDSNRLSDEAGGITQHIGAYQVGRNSEVITFIDTPGHEAFTAMRARGADATDIVILVVAADDGVMPQTIEAINHAKAAEVPILVAVNKIDRDNADVQKTIAGLADNGLVPEAWGGDTIYCEVSALNNVGITDLLDELLVLAEVEDLKASSEGRAAGVVLESHLDVGRGAIATLLVQSGTLQVGDSVVTGSSWGRVRALHNDRGESVEFAGPSMPVQVLGMSDVAAAGDSFAVAPSERIAGRVANTREYWQRLSNLSRGAHVSSDSVKLESIFDRLQRGESASFNVIVKADVNGSLEAVTDSLRKLERDEVHIGFVHKGVGGITENDVQLAAVTGSTIVGFNVRPDRKAREAAESQIVEIRTYEVIYKLLEDVTAAIDGMLAPETEEVVTGEAEVREVFRVPRVGAVAGCYVQSGVITRGTMVRFLREGAIIWKGNVSSLKRFASDVREVNAGFECGIGLEEFQDLKRGDVIEAFTEREIARDAVG